MSEGWIKLHRQIAENPLWLSEPFTRAQAWIDLIMLANHAPGIIRVRGIVVTVERGAVGWSEVNLGKRWSWSRGKVRRFLKQLKAEQQIVQQSDNITACIAIVNYDLYQSGDTADGTASGTANGQQTVPQTDSRQYPNKNEKKNKNENNGKKEDTKHPIGWISVFSVPSDRMEFINPSPETQAPKFTEFVRAYPKPYGKRESAHLWNLAIQQGADPEAVIAGVSTCPAVVEAESVQYCLSMARYLEGWRWQDEANQEATDEIPDGWKI